MIELVSIEDSTGAENELVVPRPGDVIEWKLHSLRPDTCTGTLKRCEYYEGELWFEANYVGYDVCGRLSSIISINGQKVGTQ
jgi:hypothetical protein